MSERRVRVELGERGYEVVGQAQIRRPGWWWFRRPGDGGPEVGAA
jgi:hypothetical protein